VFGGSAHAGVSTHPQHPSSQSVAECPSTLSSSTIELLLHLTHLDCTPCVSPCPQYFFFPICTCHFSLLRWRRTRRRWGASDLAPHTTLFPPRQMISSPTFDFFDVLRFLLLLIHADTPLSPCVALSPGLSGDAFFFPSPTLGYSRHVCFHSGHPSHTGQRTKTNPSCVASIARAHYYRHEQLVFYSGKAVGVISLGFNRVFPPLGIAVAPRVATHRLSSSIPIPEKCPAGFLSKILALLKSAERLREGAWS